MLSFYESFRADAYFYAYNCQETVGAATQRLNLTSQSS